MNTQQRSTEQTRLVALTLMVQTCSFAPVSWDWRWLDEAPRVSAHSDGLVFLSSQKAFLSCGGDSCDSGTI